MSSKSTHNVKCAGELIELQLFVLALVPWRVSHGRGSTKFSLCWVPFSCCFSVELPLISYCFISLFSLWRTRISSLFFCLISDIYLCRVRARPSVRLQSSSTCHVSCWYNLLFCDFLYSLRPHSGCQLFLYEELRHNCYWLNNWFLPFGRAFLPLSLLTFELWLSIRSAPAKGSLTLKWIFGIRVQLML